MPFSYITTLFFEESCLSSPGGACDCQSLIIKHHHLGRQVTHTGHHCLPWEWSSSQGSGIHTLFKPLNLSSICQPVDPTPRIILLKLVCAGLWSHASEKVLNNMFTILYFTWTPFTLIYFFSHSLVFTPTFKQTLLDDFFVVVKLFF